LESKLVPSDLSESKRDRVLMLAPFSSLRIYSLPRRGTPKN
jgi:hypothetical protein